MSELTLSCFVTKDEIIPVAIDKMPLIPSEDEMHLMCLDEQLLPSPSNMNSAVNLFSASALNYAQGSLMGKKM